LDPPDGWTPPNEGGSVTGGIVGVGVVIGAVLILELGGGVVTLAAVDGGMLAAAAEAGLQLFVTESSAYPSGHVTVGATVVVGVVNCSHVLWQQRR